MSNTVYLTGKKQLGLGTWQSKVGEVRKAIHVALEAGYRHLDLASNYLNEAEVGDALTEAFEKGTVKREDLHLTGKLNNPYHRKEHVKEHCLKTLRDLNVAYLDLYLMHWPVAFKYVPFDPNRRGFDPSYDPDDSGGGTLLDREVSIKETWQAMEELVSEGLVKAIGVSNFTAIQLHDLLTYAKVPVSVNQVEMHPYLQQNNLIVFCAQRGILVEAYSPLGTGGFKGSKEPTLLHDPTLRCIAMETGKSVAQVALRWAVQRGIVPLAKSVTPSRIKANFAIFDWSLTEAQMREIAELDRDYHFLRPQEWYGVPLFTP